MRSAHRWSLPSLRRWPLVAAGAAIAAAPAWAVPVTPGHGVTIAQVDFILAGTLLPSSSTGRLAVDVPALRLATGVNTGFLNVSTAQGWVVQNLPVFAEYPAGGLAVAFKLADVFGVNVTSLSARVDFSPGPSLVFSGGSMTAFPVGDTVVAIGGKGEVPPTLAALQAIPLLPLPPIPGGTIFDPLGETFVCCQKGHSNVEAADDQCGPAAVANSLDYLRGKHPFFFQGLPPHQMGLGNDGSLVGGLETKMGRTFRDRRDGDPIDDRPFLEGKMGFLEDEGLDGFLIVKHMDNEFGDENVTSASGFATSFGQGKQPSGDFLIKEICDGEDVEIGYSFPGGGHWVTGVCAGKVMGKPFLMYLSDWDQSDDTAGTGADAVHFSFLEDSDSDGLLNLRNESGQGDIDIAVAESPNPELDYFLWFDATLTAQAGTGTETVPLHGTATISADVAALADRDGNGREEIPVELVQLELAGTSAALGPVQLRLPPAGIFSRLALPGEIEERVNATPGVLDLPPFTATGTADSFFDIFFNISVAGQTVSNLAPAVFQSVISFKPCAPGESYALAGPVELVDSFGRPTGYTLTAATFTPRPVLPVTLTQTLNRGFYGTGDTLVAGIDGSNLGPALDADLYYGVMLPNGSLLFLTNLSPLGMFLTGPGTPRDFLPLFAGLHLGSGFSASFSSFFSYTFGGWEPAGSYVFFAALCRPEAFHDGRLDPDDVLALSPRSFTFVPPG